jgi:hypothetical protein
MTLDAMCKSDASTISLAKNGDDGQIAPSVEGLRKKDLMKLNDMWCKGSMALESGATSKAEQFLQKAGIRRVAFYAGGMRTNNPANSISAVCGNISTGWMQ